MNPIAQGFRADVEAQECQLGELDSPLRVAAPLLARPFAEHVEELGRGEEVPLHHETLRIVGQARQERQDLLLGHGPRQVGAVDGSTVDDRSDETDRRTRDVVVGYCRFDGFPDRGREDLGENFAELGAELLLLGERQLAGGEAFPGRGKA